MAFAPEILIARPPDRRDRFGWTYYHRTPCLAPSRSRRSAAFATFFRAIARCGAPPNARRSEEHTSELQSQSNLVCRLLLEKKKKTYMSGPSYVSIMKV